MANVYLKLGSKATTFYDMATGLQISNKEVVEVNEQYINKGRRTKRAIQGGHVTYATKEEYEKYKGKTSSPKEETASPDDFSTKFYNLYKEGKSVKEIADAFTKGQLISLADLADLEVEDSDTKVTLVEALIEQIKSEDE